MISFSFFSYVQKNKQIIGFVCVFIIQETGAVCEERHASAYNELSFVVIHDIVNNCDN